MIVDTEKFTTLADGVRDAGFSQSTGYRLAKKLGIVFDFFGVKIMRKSDIKTLQDNRRRVGNQDWIASYDIAADAARAATKSRMERKKREADSAAAKRTV